jgi:LmbE family N-acetylglucosaminyl deacetylase
LRSVLTIWQGVLNVKQTVWLALMFALGAYASESPTATEHAGSDERYKADILLIVAHPDDETGDVAGYLARAIFDEHRRVAVIYTTRGQGGGNGIGKQRGNALGAVREMEARQALAYLGVTNVWFLEASNVGGTVLGSLEAMDHGSALAQVVRLVRLIRPEVIITWLPLPVAGENHGDHQAASVIANEAFDLAGDPTAFAEQTSGGQDAVADAGPEGLRPWQSKKIYYFSDAYDASGYWWPKQASTSPYRKNFLDQAGPAYSNTEVSPAKRVSYARLSAEETSFYLTQSGGRIGKQAIARGVFTAFEPPMHFVLGKSLVGGSITGDVFEGVTPASIAFVRPPGFQPQTSRGMSLQLGGEWAFYREFWRAHALDTMANLLPVPEVSIGLGETLHIPLIIRNETESGQKVTVRAVLPNGWDEAASSATLSLPAKAAWPLHRVVSTPATGKPGWYELTWTAEAGGQQIGNILVRVYVDAAG